jgi:phosphate transport system substrate-binding protein
MKIGRFRTAGPVCGLALGIAALVAVTAPAQATVSAGPTPIYMGTATLEGIIDRQLFNCFGVAVQQNAPGVTQLATPFPLTSTTTCPTQPVNSSVEFITANTTTGPIQGTYLVNNPNNYNGTGGTLVGSISSTTPIPWTSPDFPTLPWPSYQLGDTISPLTGPSATSGTQLYGYNNNFLPATDPRFAAGNITALQYFGPAVQFPTMEGGITFPFNPNLPDGTTLAIKYKAPKGGSTGLRLSRNSYCGIFSGGITDWNDPSLTADNGGAYLAPSYHSQGLPAPITVIYREEKVSTSAQLSLHLQTVCGTTSYPWTFGVSQNWPGPKTGNFIGTPLPAFGGIAGMVNYIGDGSANFPGHPGSIGYAGQDYVLPISAVQNPTVAQVPAANLQNPNISATSFLPPTAKNFQNALAKAVPPSFTNGTALDPYNWGVTVPNPVAGYPLSNFVFVQMYTCYQPANLTALTSYFQWYFISGKTTADAVLTADGFSPLPGPWLSAVINLLFHKSTALQMAGKAGVCLGGA